MVHLRKMERPRGAIPSKCEMLEVLAVRGSFGIQGNVNEEQVPDQILTMGGIDNISEEYSSTLYKGSQ